MTATVTILCRLVSGITLQLSETDSIASSSTPVIRSITLNGAQTDKRYTPKHHNRTHCTGRTHIDATFWKNWLTHYKDTPLIKKRLIFVETKADWTERDIAELENKVM